MGNISPVKITTADYYVNVINELETRKTNLISDVSNNSPDELVSINNSLIDLNKNLIDLLLYDVKNETNIDKITKLNDKITNLKNNIDKYENEKLQGGTIITPRPYQTSNLTCPPCERVKYYKYYLVGMTPSVNDIQELQYMDDNSAKLINDIITNYKETPQMIDILNLINTDTTNTVKTIKKLKKNNLCNLYETIKKYDNIVIIKETIYDKAYNDMRASDKPKYDGIVGIPQNCDYYLIIDTIYKKNLSTTFCSLYYPKEPFNNNYYVEPFNNYYKSSFNDDKYYYI